MSKPVKSEWVIIRWDGQAWRKDPKTVSRNIHHHQEAVRLAKLASPDPRLVVSIHTCWLPDIHTWESPYEGTPGMASAEQRLNDQIAKLSPHDRREYRKFLKFLTVRAKFGVEVLMKRPFWRKYLGLEIK